MAHHPFRTEHTQPQWPTTHSEQSTHSLNGRPRIQNRAHTASMADHTFRTEHTQPQWPTTHSEQSTHSLNGLPPPGRSLLSVHAQPFHHGSALPAKAPLCLQYPTSTSGFNLSLLVVSALLCSSQTTLSTLSEHTLHPASSHPTQACLPRTPSRRQLWQRTGEQHMRRSVEHCVDACVHVCVCA